MRKLNKKQIKIDEYKEKLKNMTEEEIVKEFKSLSEQSNPFDIKRRIDSILDEIEKRKGVNKC